MRVLCRAKINWSLDVVGQEENGMHLLDMLMQSISLGRVRILLRYSGTQPLARVMVEGGDEEQVRWAAETLAAAVRRGVGETMA